MNLEGSGTWDNRQNAEKNERTTSVRRFSIRKGSERMAKVRERSRLTTLCYVERGDAYLMLHRIKKENDVNKDKWIGIGGHFEAGESPEECIRREAMEEAGLTLERLRFRGIVTFCFQKPEAEDSGRGAEEKSGGGAGAALADESTIPWDEWEYMCLFTAETDSDVVQECNEGELTWVKKERIGELELWEGDRIFFRLLQEEAPFFYFKLCYYGNELMEALLNGEVFKNY